MESPDDWVFGYGSLVAENLPRPDTPGGPIWAELEGHRRTWNIAMANADPVSDPKHYVDPETGDRPDIYVAFVNVTETGAGACLGVLIPADAAGLAAFDHREVNYRRIDVGDRISPRPEGRIWTYVGLDAAIERFRRGDERGTAFVAEAYVKAVRRGFQGETWSFESFLASTDSVTVPSRALSLVRRDPP